MNRTPSRRSIYAGSSYAGISPRASANKYGHCEHVEVMGVSVRKLTAAEVLEFHTHVGLCMQTARLLPLKRLTKRERLAQLVMNAEARL